MNAGTLDGGIGDFVSAVYFLHPDGTLGEFKPGSGMTFRSFDAPPRSVLIGCRLQLHRRPLPEIQKDIKQRLKVKKSTQPLALASAGWVWKNPPDELPPGSSRRPGSRASASTARRSRPSTPTSSSTAAARWPRDIMALMEMTRERVHAHFGILLEPEIRISVSRVLITPRAPTRALGEFGQSASSVAGQRVGRVRRRRPTRRIRWLRVLGTVAATAAAAAAIVASGYWVLTTERFAVVAVEVRGASRVPPSGSSRPPASSTVRTSGGSTPSACGPGWRRCPRSVAPTWSVSCPTGWPSWWRSAGRSRSRTPPACTGWTRTGACWATRPARSTPRCR